jgi:hypothetical protein
MEGIMLAVKKAWGKLVILGVLSSLGLAFASYYKNDLFPIGLTGINLSGWTCPYSEVDTLIDTLNITWDWNDEKALIFDLGVNCIGSQDAYPPYLMDWSDTTGSKTNNYLYKVCEPSFADDGDSANPEHIYIIEFIDITELIDSLIADSLPDSLNLED